MGVHFMGSNSTFDKEPENLGNPNPNNWEIMRSSKTGRYLLVEIKYLDCNNYEGRKILMFKDIEKQNLIEQGIIDPHFSENKQFHSPIARFEPTKEGWIMGKALCSEIKFEEKLDKV